MKNWHSDWTSQAQLSLYLLFQCRAKCQILPQQESCDINANNASIGHKFSSQITASAHHWLFCLFVEECTLTSEHLLICKWHKSSNYVVNHLSKAHTGTFFSPFITLSKQTLVMAPSSSTRVNLNGVNNVVKNIQQGASEQNTTLKLKSRLSHCNKHINVILICLPKVLGSLWSRLSATYNYVYSKKNLWDRTTTAYKSSNAMQKMFTQKLCSLSCFSGRRLTSQQPLTLVGHPGLATEGHSCALLTFPQEMTSQVDRCQWERWHLSTSSMNDAII